MAQQKFVQCELGTGKGLVQESDRKRREYHRPQSRVQVPQL